MSKLITCSYICSVLAFIMWCLLATKVLDKVHSLHDEDLFFVLFAVPPVLQMLYTRRAASMVNLRKYKPSHSLDDYAINDISSEEQVVFIGLGWKAVNTVNSLLMSLYVLILSSALPYLLGEFASGNFNDAEDFAMVLAPIVYGFAIPAVIFNLRTFNLRRIRNVAVN